MEDDAVQDAWQRSWRIVEFLLADPPEPDAADREANALCIERDADGLWMMARVAIGMVTSLGVDAKDWIDSLKCPQILVEVRGYSRAILFAILDDPTSRSDELHEAIRAARNYAINNVAGDLAVVCATAVNTLARANNRLPLEFVHEMATTPPTT